MSCSSPTLMRRSGLAPAGLAAGFLALALSLGGCALIGQKTFAPSPAATPPLIPPAPKADKRVALVTIQAGTPIAQYRQLLHYAVEAARKRDPAVRFDVTSVVPAKGDAATQEAALAKTQSQAAATMREIIAAGVDASHVQLRAMADPDAPGPQIRVYVR